MHDGPRGRSACAAARSRAMSGSSASALPAMSVGQRQPGRRFAVGAGRRSSAVDSSADREQLGRVGLGRGRSPAPVPCPARSTTIGRPFRPAAKPGSLVSATVGAPWRARRVDDGDDVRRARPTAQIPIDQRVGSMIGRRAVQRRSIDGVAEPDRSADGGSPSRYCA